ncbi:hypothetical protein FACS189445_5910 [Spirochaetia bacterium]|nr:hypothetical protein FACS189445_5910 [Spirochaetia bacterium]
MKTTQKRHKNGLVGVAAVALAFGLVMVGCEEPSEYGGEVVLNNQSSETVTGRSGTSSGPTTSFEVAAGQKKTIASHFDSETVYESADVTITNTGLQMFKTGGNRGIGDGRFGGSGTFTLDGTITITIKDPVTVTIDFAPVTGENAFTLTLSEGEWNTSVPYITNALTGTYPSSPFTITSWSGSSPNITATAVRQSDPSILKVTLTKTSGTLTGGIKLETTSLWYILDNATSVGFGSGVTASLGTNDPLTFSF